MTDHLRASARVLGPLRPDSIRNRILLFALVAALVPSVTTALIAYRQNRRAILEQTTKDLQIASEQATREMDLWLKERLHELRTFTGSYEITENLERAQRDPAAANRIIVYLSSLHSRFPEHAELFVLDARGRMVAQRSRGPRCWCRSGWAPGSWWGRSASRPGSAWWSRTSGSTRPRTGARISPPMTGG
jgi:hypothetical protein